MSKHTISGVVSSIAGDKTIVVTRTVRKTHPLYGKKFTVTSKFHAHDENNQAHVGDTVTIVESRPYSKTVDWELNKIVIHGREKLEIKKNEIEEQLEAKSEKTEEVSPDQPNEHEAKEAK